MARGTVRCGEAHTLSRQRPGMIGRSWLVNPVVWCMQSLTRTGLLCATGLSLLLGGCTEVQLLTANAVAAFGPYTRYPDIAYQSAPARALDVYVPRHALRAPVAVFFYGGGWNSGARASYRFVGAALAKAGIIAVIPDYTLYPQGKFPVFMRDAAHAVAWARAHASDWGGDPAQLYLIGHSAGAHIAVLLALDAEYLQQVGGSTRWLRGVVGLSGPYDFLPFTDAYLNDLFGPPEQFARSQPIHYVRSDAPPLLLMHGLKDGRVSPTNTQHLAAALQQSGGQVKALYFPEADHAGLVAAFSDLSPGRLPVLADVRAFIVSDPVHR